MIILFFSARVSLSAERHISHLVHVYLKEVELVTSDQRVPAKGVGIQDAQVHCRLHELVSTEASGGGKDGIINGGGSVVAVAVLAALAVAAVVANRGRAAAAAAQRVKKKKQLQHVKAACSCKSAQ